MRIKCPASIRCLLTTKKEIINLIGVRAENVLCFARVTLKKTWAIQKKRFNKATGREMLVLPRLLPSLARRYISGKADRQSLF